MTSSDQPISQQVDQILQRLQAHANPSHQHEMQRVGISATTALGVKLPHIRQIAKEYKRQHKLALALWDTAIHEARLLATMIDDPGKVTTSQLKTWSEDFASWDLCDQACSNLFARTSYARDLPFQWCHAEEVFVKRAGFVMIASLAIHDKKADNLLFHSYFPLILDEAHDHRNFVKKAINWAIRQVGKRNLSLHQAAISLAEEIRQQSFPTAKWIASDALRELNSEKIIARLHR